MDNTAPLALIVDDDIDWVEIVSLDEIRVVAVHRAHEAGERCLDGTQKAPAEPGRLPGEVEREVV